MSRKDTGKKVAAECLRYLGAQVDCIPESSTESADLVATFGKTRTVIEVKEKIEDPDTSARRNRALSNGEMFIHRMPVAPNNGVSGIVQKAGDQLRSTDYVPSDFRLLWIFATGYTARAKFEQIKATLYGLQNVLGRDDPVIRRCYYFGNSEFFRNQSIIDGAVVGYVVGSNLTATLCLNSLSQRYEALRDSEVAAFFSNAVEDPEVEDASGRSYVANTDIDRGSPDGILRFLEQKYQSGPLMEFGMAYNSAIVPVGVPSDRSD